MPTQAVPRRRGAPPVRRRVVVNRAPRLDGVVRELGDDTDMMALYTRIAGDDLGLSLKPPEWLRKLKPLKAAGSAVKTIAPVAAGFLVAGPAGAAAAAANQLVGGGGGAPAATQAVEATQYIPVPQVQPVPVAGGAAINVATMPGAAGLLMLPPGAEPPSMTKLASMDPKLATALAAATVADNAAAAAEAAARSTPGNPQKAAEATQRRTVAQQLRTFAESLYREILYRSTQVAQAAQAAGAALDAGSQAWEHMGNVTQTDPAPAWAGVINMKPWMIGVGAGAAVVGIIMLTRPRQQPAPVYIRGGGY